jgi:hypothetical protein
MNHKQQGLQYGLVVTRSQKLWNYLLLMYYCDMLVLVGNNGQPNYHFVYVPECHLQKHPDFLGYLALVGNNRALCLYHLIYVLVALQPPFVYLVTKKPRKLKLPGFNVC